MIIRNKAILTFGTAYRQASNSGRVIEIGLVLLTVDERDGRREGTMNLNHPHHLRLYFYC